MAAKAGCPSTFAAVVLVFVNIIVLMVCVALLSFGIWAIASPSSLANMIQTLPYLVVKALLPPEVVTARLGAGVAALAAFVACIAGMGLRGAVNRSPFLLFMYPSLVLLLLLLECALFYYFSSNLMQNCKETISFWLDRYQTIIYIALAVVHIMLSSCSLVRRRKRRSANSYS